MTALAEAERSGAGPEEPVVETGQRHAPLAGRRVSLSWGQRADARARSRLRAALARHPSVGPGIGFGQTPLHRTRTAPRGLP